MFTHYERATKLNDADMLAVLPDVLADLDLDVRLDVDDAPDQPTAARVHLGMTGAGGTTYLVQVKRRMTPGLATALVLDPSQRVLLVAPHITEGVGAVLREISVNYVDMVGNAYLRWPGVHIDVRGRRVTAPSTGTGRGNRAFTRAGLQVMFVLLSQPASATATLRELATASGTSLGTAQAVVGELEQEGALVPTTQGRRLHRAGRWFDRWVEGYATRLSSSLSIRSFHAEDLGWWPEARAMEPDVVVGGEAAASALDPMLRPASVTFYVTDLPGRLIRAHRLVPAEARQANVHLRRRFWAQGFDEDDGMLAPSTLVYADLVTSGEPRLREHAHRLRERDARLVELDRS